MEQLKESLRNQKYEKMTPVETIKHRNKFNGKKTGQKWPPFKKMYLFYQCGK